jgi:hydroxyacylglutathione hydrolase
MAIANFILHPIRLVNVSCYLYYRDGEAMLVDSGNAGSEERILSEMLSVGLEPEMLKILVLTHAHFDHAGSAGRLKEMTGCRIMIHQSEAGRLKDGYTDLPAGTRWKAKVLVGLGRTFAKRLGSFPHTEPDLLVDQDYALDKIGFPARVIHTPGHTRGSMVVKLDSGELIAGDSVFGVEGKQHFPPFAEDLPALVKSWRVIRDLKADTIFPAHGRPVSKESFEGEFTGAMKKYDRKLTT